MGAQFVSPCHIVYVYEVFMMVMCSANTGYGNGGEDSIAPDNEVHHLKRESGLELLFAVFLPATHYLPIIHRSVLMTSI